MQICLVPLYAANVIPPYMLLVDVVYISGLLNELTVELPTGTETLLRSIFLCWTVVMLDPVNVSSNLSINPDTAPVLLNVLLAGNEVVPPPIVSNSLLTIKLPLISISIFVFIPYDTV